MRTFLHHVAEALLERYGTDMSRLTVVFPGKRAGLFLEQALADIATTPVWAPRYTTIAELFQQLSPYTLCDNIEGVARLYASYARLADDPWPIDRFYGWGEILLSDFDDIDKHRVDPRRLFTNIADLRAMDDTSYITPEQEAALRQFFADFSLEANTELKERFLRLWNIMADIYDDLQATMRADSVLYDGALQRDVAERLRVGADAEAPAAAATLGDVAFVGFNLLSPVEEALFDYLQRQHRALFFWDYDRFYVNARQPHEAGYFVARNLQRYGNALDSSLFDNLAAHPDITLVAATSENAQARYLPTWLAQHLPANGKSAHASPGRENQTAIVLANEHLLQAVLHSIPTAGSAGAPREVNITMGYPMADTPVFSFVEALMALHTEGWDAGRRRFRLASVRAVRRHPFFAYADADVLFAPLGHDSDPDSPAAATQLLDFLLAVLAQLPRGQEAKEALQTLNVEAIFQACTALMRLRDLTAPTADRPPLLPVGAALMRRLVRSVLVSRSIPFHGEPATGLQVMGILETRALDFSHVAILSTGEGFLPRTSGGSSFIPFNLREAFGLTTTRHQEAVYAYYFYRLLQRAGSVTLMYNESNIGMRQNEMSRFVRQLMAETDFPIRHLQLDPDGDRPDPDGGDVQHADTMPPGAGPERPQAADGDKRERPLALSPSAMNAYTACHRRYYYQYVCGMRIDPDPHDGLDAILFGQVFHRAAELLYRHLTERTDTVRGEDLDPYLEQGGHALDPFVRQAFSDAFFSQARDASGNVVGMAEEYTGILLIARDVVRTYLQQLLRNDRRHTPFRVLGIEVKRYVNIRVEVPGADGGAPQTLSVSTGGIIDRLDEVADGAVDGGRMVRVVDYKTGGRAEAVASIDSLFADTDQERQHAFQTILYAVIVAAREPKPVAPCLFYVHRAGADDYSPHITVEKQQLLDVRAVATDFAANLRSLVAEILDPNNSFEQTSNADTCRYCNYRRLCER